MSRPLRDLEPPLRDLEPTFPGILSCPHFCLLVHCNQANETDLSGIANALVKDYEPPLSGSLSRPIQGY